MSMSKKRAAEVAGKLFNRLPHLCGPAFPATRGEHLGMSLRDWFAGMALAGGLEQHVEDDVAEAFPDKDMWWHEPKKIARRAYAIADAMLAERAK